MTRKQYISTPRRILVFLKPSWLTLFFFILALRFVSPTWHQVIVDGVSGPGESSVDYGGALQLHYNSAGDYVSYSIEPFTFAKTFIALYSVALLLTKLVQRATWLKWWAIAGLVPIAIAAAAIISNQMWGFYFYRPDVSAFASHFSTVSAVSGITTGGYEVKPETFSADPEFSIEKELRKGEPTSEDEGYYMLSGRILAALSSRGLLPEATAPVDGLPELFRAVQTSGELVPADEGYGPHDQLAGVAVQGHSAKGEPLFFVGVRSPQLSNDHYAWYELLFTRAPDGKLKLLRTQHFFFDWAGLEYISFQSMAVGFVSLAYIILLPLLILIVEAKRSTGGLFRSRHHP